MEVTSLVSQGAELEVRCFPGPELCLRDGQGAASAGDGRRWISPATAADELVLDHAIAPVLDIGCGPGRHLLALARRGVDALGLDVTLSAVRLARSRGAAVVHGSIFETVPESGTWSTALLLDGNIGIGGDPIALLVRVGDVMRPGGRILVEVGAPGASDGARRARLDQHGCLGPWFDWATVGASSLEGIATAARMVVSDAWRADGRWFARIETSVASSIPEVV